MLKRQKKGENKGVQKSQDFHPSQKHITLSLMVHVSIVFLLTNQSNRKISAAFWK